ncbi:uncharacterized protein LOC106672540 [Cimex lectularius]|uniref:EF-hand domain-containing protein n=1 Tax=Cimex lectularius TaxID=79782 RepID=A0A8I6SAE3_CIMLE|nr:uncharacterized protein LOC106672540 [Cimex lectularius]
MDEGVGDCEVRGSYDIWHSLKRIQAATYRTGFNFWDIFRDLEPPGKRITAEHRFLSVLCGPLKHIIGLTDEEILNIAAFFRTSDGRVDFDQFCRTIHDSDPPEEQVGKKMEAEDPYTTKSLKPKSERHLQVILTKMACEIEKPYVLRPYFQEYQDVKKSSGLISRSGFFRILDFLGIHLSDDERELILSKYSFASHNIKYAAFLKDLIAIKEHLKDRGMLDTSGKLLPIYKSQYPNVEFPMLPTPDMHAAEIDWNRIGLSRARTDPKFPWKEVLVLAFARLKQHIKFEKINLCDYFLRRDPRGTGKIPTLHFRQALEWIKYSRKTLTDLHLSQHEKSLITSLYIDPEESDRFLWHPFVKDVYEDMNMEEVANWPPTPLTTPPDMMIDRLPRIPYPESAPAILPKKEFFEEFYKKVIDRDANIHALLRARDSKKDGTVTLMEFAEAMKRYHFLFSEEELMYFLHKYGIGEEQINYEKLAEDFPLRIEKKNLGYGVQQNEEKEMERERAAAKEQEFMENNIVEILAKIKRIIICSHVKLEHELKNLDEEKSGVLPWFVFLSTLENNGISLSDPEKNCLRQVFHKDGDANFIEYGLFYPTVDEGSNVPCLSRMPLHEAMRYEKEKVAKQPHEFVNFADRVRISQAVKKLSRKVTLGNYDLFKAEDVNNTGVVDKQTFLHILFQLGVLHLISLAEADSIMKGFGYEINNKLYIDYQDFLNALDIVLRTEKAALRL